MYYRRYRMKRLAPLVASLGLMPLLGATAFAAEPNQQPAAKAPAAQRPWVGYIYIDLNGSPGADRVIKLLPDRTWELREPSGKVGLYDVKLANGAVIGDGKLDGLPATAFHGARIIWKAGTVATLIEGKRIPSSQQLCNGKSKAGLGADFVVPKEKDWLEYCSKRLTT